MDHRADVDEAAPGRALPGGGPCGDVRSFRHVASGSGSGVRRGARRRGCAGQGLRPQAAFVQRRGRPVAAGGRARSEVAQDFLQPLL
ncbi:MAG: hypothetical protein ACK56I_23600, partial [bacterium]